MPRYTLRTLQIVLALGPPIIALEWWYLRESSLALLIPLVVIVSLIVWLLDLTLWALARIYDALCQLIGVKPRRIPADKLGP